MANQITHIVLAKKMGFNEKNFLIGTVFPDIRYLRVIEREKTHFHDLTYKGILDEENPFIAGMKYHSLVDEVREIPKIRELILGMYENWKELIQKTDDQK